MLRSTVHIISHAQLWYAIQHRTVPITFLQCPDNFHSDVIYWKKAGL